MGNRKQYLISLGVVLLVSLVCYAVSPWLGYRVIALVMLLAVSLLAVMLDILPVLVAATLSAFIWDFFFIPPRFTFHVNTTEDLILLIMYFVIALISGVLTNRIKRMEEVARKKEEKVKSLKLYDTILNSLSHELRTPIASIIAATDNMQAGKHYLPERTKDELIDEIAKASFRLNEQVENLLNMSRLDSGFIKPKMDWTDITELIYDVVRKTESNGIQQKIAININPDLPLVRTDKMLLTQVMYNLLSNATRYTLPGSLINIIAKVHTDILQIVIEDNGPGFPPDEIGDAFDKFYRLRSSKAGGTGLGLSIAKGFIEVLGGTITLENVITGGARFMIQLPCKTSYTLV
jgi:two-component system sensor histidine kinase KdpD